MKSNGDRKFPDVCVCCRINDIPFLPQHLCVVTNKQRSMIQSGYRSKSRIGSRWEYRWLARTTEKMLIIMVSERGAELDKMGGGS